MSAAFDLCVAVPDDHPAFAGHFPGQPLLPGVVLLAWVLEAVLAQPHLAQRLGSAPKLASAKFLAPVLPGDVLRVTVLDESAGLRFEVHSRDRLACTGRWDGASP